MKTGDNVQPEKPTHQRYVLAAVLLVVVFFSYIDRVNVSILVVDPHFLEAMGISDSSVQKGLLMSLFLASYGIGNVLLSPLGDLLGPRKAMSISIIIWSISLVIGGLAGSFAIMLTSRVLLGFGEGMHFPMQSKFIKEWFPPHERGKANAVWQTGMALAPAIAMPFFAWLIHVVGWRESFFVLLTMGLIPLSLVLGCTADTPQDSKRINKAELQHIQDGLYAEKSWQSLPKPTFIAGVKSFASNYQFWLVVIYYMVHTSILWGAMTWLPSYLKEARGFSWEAMGALASLPWFLGLFAKIISGVLADKFKRRAPIILVAMIGVAMGIYLGATAESNMGSAIFLGIGVGFIGLGGPTAWTIMQDIVPAKGVSTAAGVMNGVGNGFSALAPVAIGFLISITGSYMGGLLYLVGCAALGAVVMLILIVSGR